MVRTITSVGIDPYLLERAKEANICISRVLAEHLEHLLAKKNNDITQLDLMIENKRLEQLKIKMTEMTQQMTKHTENIRLYKELQESLAMKKAEEEKKIILEKQTCIKCKQLIDNFEFAKKDKTKDGRFLHPRCVLDTTREERQEWFGV